MTKKSLIAVYVSGHGFGHATRTGEVLRCLRELHPACPLAVATSAPEWLFRQAIPGPFEFRAVQCDVGVVQRGALVIDEEATAAGWRDFAAGWSGRLEGESAWLAAVGARLVLADIPPLAFAAAARAGVPAVGMANFSWDWIYAHLGARHPALTEAAAHSAAAYGTAELLLELPFAGHLSAFPVREPIPLVARRPLVARHEARSRLGLASTQRAVLLSFGGLGLETFEPATLSGLRRYRFFVDGARGRLPANFEVVDRSRLQSLGLGYRDLVGAADVVVTKPGYGIVADAIAARTRLVYTERGDFPEYPVLVRELPRYLPAVHVSNADLMAGRLQEPLTKVLALPLLPAADTSGGTVAARRLLEQMG